MRRLLPLFLLIILLFSSCSREKSAGVSVVEIIHSTDVHGNVFPYDFVSDRENPGSYARISSYVTALRDSGAAVILLDAGDILQGQPTAYYYNFIDTTSHHLISDVLNYLKYDAVTVGNHDIEPGHAVYDRWKDALEAPLLGANVLSKGENKSDTVSYFTPYTVIERGGLRVAVLGLTTPAVPNFLPPVLWSGMEFEDIVQSARRIMPRIMAEKPDMVVAMIHSGRGEHAEETPSSAENAGFALAEAVPGIDLILCGHDHRQYIDSLKRSDGSVVYLVNPGFNGTALSRTTVSLSRDKSGKRHLSLIPRVISLENTPPDKDFIQAFRTQFDATKEFVQAPVGSITEDLDARGVLFGPSAFTDLIHEVQLSLFDSAQISITAPLDVEYVIPRGEILMRDLFKLYRYENGVNLMRLSGEEIRKELEASYANWVGTMRTSQDHLLQLQIPSDPESSYLPLIHPAFNYDSAKGIRYTVDVRKPVGERVTILSMKDGSPFDPHAYYRVVMNSYRASGGGELLTEGAGIARTELSQRILASKEHDLRFYLRAYLQKHSPLTPRVTSDWAFVPAEWTRPAAERDSLYLFGND